MRIAVAGTHCSGKSTLIEAFLRTHTDFAHEPEPYTTLLEDYGEEFAAEPCAEDFYRQLEFSADRLQQHSRGAQVIYERSPVDFLAYLLALNDLKRDASALALISVAQGLVSDAIRNLDLIVFLPLDHAHNIEVPEEEHPELREAVDSQLVSILGDDELGIVSSAGVAVVEARGSTGQRLRTIEEAMRLWSAAA